QAEDGIRDRNVTGVQTCALPISLCSKRTIHTRGDREQLRGPHLDDGRELPASGNQLQRPVRESGRLKHGGEVERMPLISCLAVGTVCAAVAGQIQAIEKVVPIITDAMRPRVICQNIDPTAQALLNRKQQAVVVAGTAIVQREDGSVVLPLSRIL